MGRSIKQLTKNQRSEYGAKHTAISHNRLQICMKASNQSRLRFLKMTLKLQHLKQYNVYYVDFDQKQQTT